MIWAVKDAMKVLGISISASCMFLSCPHVSTSHSPSSNVQCLLKYHKTVPKSSSTFLMYLQRKGMITTAKVRVGVKVRK